MTMCLLTKPYETLRFHTFSSMIVPVLVFAVHLKIYAELFNNSLFDVILYLQSKTYIYIGAFCMFFLVKSYVI